MKMTKQDEENVLIAKFMGFEDKDYEVEKLRYDCDWNWLIPVVNRIRLLRSTSYNKDNMRLQAKANFLENVFNNNLDKEKTYEAVINFIDYYKTVKVSNGVG